jgi:hypothetical protein
MNMNTIKSFLMFKICQHELSSDNHLLRDKLTALMRELKEPF